MIEQILPSIEVLIWGESIVLAILAIFKVIDLLEQ